MKTLLNVIVGIYLGITTVLSGVLIGTMLDKDYRQTTFECIDKIVLR